MQRPLLRGSCGQLFLYTCIVTGCIGISHLPAQDLSVATSLKGKKPGEERVFSEMKFCWCPPGEFVMGSPKSEPGRLSSEHQVSVKHTSGFWMGKYEVTQAEWQRVMNRKPSFYQGKSLPVEQVSWPDANEFCNKLNKVAKTAGKLPKGWEYRLPTEAQWEYACRAGSTTPYSFGNDPDRLGQYAWYGENSDMKTHPVGKKKGNEWGLHDMHGNVFEWCMDSFQPLPPGGDDPVVLKEARSCLSWWQLRVRCQVCPDCVTLEVHARFPRQISGNTRSPSTGASQQMNMESTARGNR